MELIVGINIIFMCISPLFFKHWDLFESSNSFSFRIDNIFGSIMTGRLSTVSPFFAVPKVVAEHVVKLTDATIQLWQKTSIKMLPTPAKFHYSCMQMKVLQLHHEIC